MSTTRSASARQAALASFAVASLLWAPLLVFELLGRHAPGLVLANPTLRASLGAAAVVALGTVILLAGPTALIAVRVTTDETARRASAWWAMAAVGLASCCVLLLRVPVHGLAVHWRLAPPVTLVLIDLLAAAAASLLVALVSRLAPAPLRGKARRGLLLASLAGWMLLVATGPARERGLAAGLVLTLGLLAVSLAAAAIGGVAAPRRTAIPLVLAAALGFGAVLTGSAAPTARAQRTPKGTVRRAAPNVLIVMIDTLRRDHVRLGPAGERRSPVLRSLASERATSFDRAWPAATSTAPSVKGLFTSQAPSRWGLGQAAEPPPPEAWNLAKAFQAAGYETAAFSANGLVDGEGFRAGFETFESSGGWRFFQDSFLLHGLLCGDRFWDAMALAAGWRLHKTPGDFVRRRLRAWLEQPRDAPFFAYLHVVEPHWPFHDRGHGLLDDRLRAVDRPLRAFDLLRLPKGDPANVRFRGTAELAELLGRYAEEVREADAITGRALADLAELGLADDTLVLVMGDHGEEFFEHHGFSHGHDVFEEQAHVPLIVRWPAAWWEPNAWPARVTEPVSLLDVLPTLTDLLDLPEPPGAVEGMSLRPLLEGGQVTRPRPLVVESFPAASCRAAHREGDRKARLEYHAALSPALTSRLVVFDLADDPAETSPLSEADPDVEAFAGRAREALAGRWEAWPDRRDTAGAAPAAPAGDDALEHLRALGYVR